MNRIFIIILCFNFFNICAQKTGINLTAGASPNTTLDVNGSVAYRGGTAITLANGANNDITLSDFSLFRITGPTAAFSVTGFTGGVNGRILTIVNATTQTMTITHQATSSAINQIQTNGSNTTLAADGVAFFIYNSSSNKWVLAGGQGFSNIAWNLTGNAGTTPGTNYIGTSDAQDVVLKAQNTEGVRIKASNSYIGLNVSNPTTRLSVSNNATIASVPSDAIAHFTNTDAMDTELLIDTYGNGSTDDPAIVLRRAAGTATTPLALRQNDAMGRISWWGHNGTNFVDQTAKIDVYASENWTATGNGSQMEFYTTRNGNTILDRQMTLSNQGNLGIGTGSSTPTARLHAENTGSNYAVRAPITTNYNYFAGNTAFGPYSSNPNDISLLWGAGAVDNAISLQKDFTSFTGTTLYRGLSAVLKLSPTAHVTNTFHGVTNDVQTSNSAFNYTSLLRLMGADFRHYGSGTVSDVEGLNAHVGNYGTGTITDAYGVYSQVFRSSGTITNSYGGLFLSSGASTNNYGLYSNPGNSATNNYMYYGTLSASTNTDWGIYLTGEDKNYFSGNMGIGCQTPQYKLHVIGDIAAQGGTLRAAAAAVSTTITACSDFRFKQNITPLSNALEKVLKLQAVTYDWRVKEFPDRYFNDKKQIGIIAQDLEKIYPELVDTDEKGYKSVDYSKITPILVEAIKEQQRLIDNQQKEIDSLKNKNTDTQNELEILKKQMSSITQQIEILLKKQN